MLLVVQHDTPHPALDGLYAAALAAAIEGAAFVRLRGPGDLGRPGGREHVAAYGALVPNPLLWPERATGRPVEAGADGRVGAWPDAERPTVLAWNRMAAPPEAAPDLEAWLAARSPAPVRIRVEAQGGVLVGRAVAGTPPELPVVRLDRFGRPRPDGPREAPAGGPPLALVGDPAHLREVYPAVLAALGDAADAANVAPRVEILSPRDLEGSGLSRLDGAAGIVLPGGSDMGQVEAQIAAARYGLERGVPTLGLCLGMQTMVTAVARARAGLAGANLEEVDPGAPVKTFRRLHDAGGRAVHRLGAMPVTIVPGTRLAAVFGRAPLVERMNHRYHLNPDVLPRLEAAGLVASGRSPDGRVVDAVEVPDHRFFCGMQGHPELSSRPSRPHPLVRAFVEAAAGQGS